MSRDFPEAAMRGTVRAPTTKEEHVITWDIITAECSGYRAGFVAVFRKYEGQPTDEKDGKGRAIKVTKNSFANHVGVPESTFRRWLGEEHQRGVAPGATRSGQIGRQIAKSPVVNVDDKVGMLSDLLSDRAVVREWSKTRAPNVTPAEAKAASAMARAVTEPIMQAVGEMEAVGVWVGTLNDMADSIAEYDLSEATVRKLRKAADRVSDEVQVQEFRLGLEVSL